MDSTSSWSVKPESHKTLYEWDCHIRSLRAISHTGVSAAGMGAFHEVHTYRYANDVPVREGEDALWVNWCELIITKATDGTIRYRNAFATKHPWIAPAWRLSCRPDEARWKVENENNNTLKNQRLSSRTQLRPWPTAPVGRVTHAESLSVFVPHSAGMGGYKVPPVRQALAARQTFFQDLQALTRYLLLRAGTSCSASCYRDWRSRCLLMPARSFKMRIAGSNSSRS